ncbi:MAG: Acetyltransferase family [Symbiobacteriaceae bacterium]|jgi:L-amino acid N-acyltransferase YncA|nr:Acetyltransferase family [Symbiobacteriaceae bacterium]
MQVRPFRQEELPAVLACSVQTAAAQLVARDLPGATSQALARQITGMYTNALMMPDATILVMDWPQGAKETGPAAYVLMMPQPNAFTGEREVIILDIYTHPALRGRKVGRLLLEHVSAYAKRVGAGSLVAQIAVHNQASRALFRSAGYAEERVVVGRRA